jgi:hypothetical protein
MTLKPAFSDGTVAIEMDPLSLLSRRAAAVPYPRLHTKRYSGVLASASTVRPRIAPKQKPISAEGEDICVHHAPELSISDEVPKRGPYRPWAGLLKRPFHFDVLECPKCEGRMRLLAMLTVGKELTCSMKHLGEPTDLPTQAPAHGPPFQKSRALRRREPFASQQLLHYGPSVRLFVSRKIARRPRRRSRVVRPPVDAKTSHQGEGAPAGERKRIGNLHVTSRPGRHCQKTLGGLLKL